MSALEIESVQAIEPQVARLYAEAANGLASDVSRLIASHPRLHDFLNGNPFRLLEVNHRNHTALMTEVLRSGNLLLLTRTLPWSYHAYHSQGLPYAYFPIQVRAWKTAIQARLSESAAAALIPIYDWMLKAHDDIVAAASRYECELAEVPGELHQSYEHLLETLTAGDHLGAIDLCHGLLKSGMPFIKLMQYLFYPAMVEIGAGWEQGRVSIAMEHQATATAYVVLSTLYHEQLFPPELRGKAIVASVSNEFHELGAWMLTACLELDGWEVDFLASDCSQATLVGAAQRDPPSFIALSITLIANVDIARETIAAVRAALPPESGTKILVGGRALLTAQSLADAIGADLFLTDCETAVTWARGLEAAR